MVALAATRLSSAARMSGRRSSNAEGRPAGMTGGSALRRFVEGLAAGDVTRVPAQQQAQRVLGPSDLALDVLERGTGCVEEIFGLRDVEAGGRAQVPLGSSELQTALAGSAVDSCAHT